MFPCYAYLLTPLLGCWLLTDDVVYPENGEGNQLWKRYHHIEMRYTKGAMDENELARYNSTHLCGLDNTLPNSYANSLLQVNLTSIVSNAAIYSA